MATASIAPKVATHVLDNVIYNTLTTRLAHLAHRHGKAVAFRPEFNLLAGLSEPTTEALADLAELQGPGSDGGVLFTDRVPEIPTVWQAKIVPVTQMICEKPNLLPIKDKFVDLTTEDVPAMTELTSLTRPGPWRPRTIELGRYIGIKINGELAAMSGERMRVPGMTEVSAVCTHPDHLGKGYAGQLMSVIMKGIFDRGESCFLHVLSTNHRAIGLYERLGFKFRYEFQYALMRRSG